MVKSSLNKHFFGKLINMKKKTLTNPFQKFPCTLKNMKIVEFKKKMSQWISSIESNKKFLNFIAFKI